MNKYRKEPFITQRQGKRGWTFQVFIRTEDATITKSFSEKDYGTAKKAFECAVAFRDKMRYEIINGTTLKVENTTVKDVFEDYIEQSPDSLSTKNKHYKLFNKYISTKDIPIQELTRADIVADLNGMTDKCQDDTIQRVLTIYRNDIVNHALFKELINRDLIAGIKCPKSRMIKVKKSTTTDRDTILEVERLVLASQMNDYNKHLIYYLMEVLYYTGMRPAEAEALTRNDILKDSIRINKQLGSSKDEMHVVTRTKELASVRYVPIHPNLKPILKELLDFARYDELFKDDNGQYMNSTAVGNTLRRILYKTGIEFNLYRLRHYMATYLVTEKTDIKTTIELLGHSDYSTSLGYANSSDKLKKQALEKFS